MMGCDIHCFIEVFDGQRWNFKSGKGFGEVIVENDPNPPPVAFSAKEDEWFWRHELDLGRSYSLFYILGMTGRRAYCIEEPIPTFLPLRGFPPDASPEVRKDHEDWGPDAHSPSWASVDDLLSIDLDQAFHFSEGPIGSYRDTMQPLLDLIPELKRLSPRSDWVRLVYWFDN